MLKTNEELKFLDEIQQNAVEWQLTIEKPARRMNQAVVFTIPKCHENIIYELFKKHRVAHRQVFNTKFNVTVGDDRMRRLNVVFDPESVSKRYLSQDEAMNYVENVAANIHDVNPKVFVDVETEGYSYEGRKIKSISIAYSGRLNNPVIFIDAGIHAREWHSRSMALYFLNKLTDEAALDTHGLLYKASFVIVPTVNPDGYEYSQRGNNMWRKTRKPVNNKCIGVDGNRNFDVHWLEGESEKIPCYDVYRGPTPFSETETKVVRDIMRRLQPSIKMYISIHTFGNSILYPYGYTTVKHPREQQLRRVAQAGVDAVKAVTGTVFVADQSGSKLYVAAGGSDDYAIDNGIPFAFTMELGAEDHGFAIPVNYLKQTLDEGFIAIKAMVLEVIRM